MRRWLGFNYLRIVMGDLACTLKKNHLNPTLFCGRGRWERKINGFFLTEVPSARLPFPFWAQTFSSLAVFNHLISLLLIYVNFVRTQRDISLFWKINDPLYSHVTTDEEPIYKMGRVNVNFKKEKALKKNYEIASSYVTMKYGIGACHLQEMRGRCSGLM